MTEFDDGVTAEKSFGLDLPNDMPHGKFAANPAIPLGIGTPSGPLRATANPRVERDASDMTFGKLNERKWPQSMRVGYAAGAYDLFHIGHLNILRQARQRCDYLIAGVVSDEMLAENKGIEAFIPEEERLSIVQSIKFVDEAVLETLPDKLDTWSALRFTVFFKGDDWRGTPKGLDLEQRFHEVGVDIEYLPYTLHTSSTKLRRALDNFERVARRH